MDETEKRIIGTFARKGRKKEIAVRHNTQRARQRLRGKKQAEKGNANSRLSITRVIHLVVRSVFLKRLSSSIYWSGICNSRYWVESSINSTIWFQFYLLMASVALAGATGLGFIYLNNQGCVSNWVHKLIKSTIFQIINNEGLFFTLACSVANLIWKLLHPPQHVTTENSHDARITKLEQALIGVTTTVQGYHHASCGYWWHSTGFAFRFERRKWNRGCNGLHQLGQPVAPSVPFPVFKSEGKPGTWFIRLPSNARALSQWPYRPAAATRTIIWTKLSKLHICTREQEQLFFNRGILSLPEAQLCWKCKLNLSKVTKKSGRQ